MTVQASGSLLPERITVIARSMARVSAVPYTGTALRGTNQMKTLRITGSSSQWSGWQWVVTMALSSARSIASCSGPSVPGPQSSNTEAPSLRTR